MERPTGVTILAVLAFISSGFLLIFALIFFVASSLLARMLQIGPGILAGLGAVLGLILLGIAALHIVTGVGLLSLKEWGRILAIIIVGFSLATGALGILHALIHFRIFILFWRALFVAIDLWILLYLFKPHVKNAFGAA